MHSWRSAFHANAFAPPAWHPSNGHHKLQLGSFSGHLWLLTPNRSAPHPHLKRFKQFRNTTCGLSTADCQDSMMVFPGIAARCACSCHFSIVDLISRAHIGCVYLATGCPGEVMLKSKSYKNETQKLATKCTVTTCPAAPRCAMPLTKLYPGSAERGQCLATYDLIPNLGRLPTPQSAAGKNQKTQ